MSNVFVKLDVNFLDNEKVMQVSETAELLYLRMLMVSKRLLSDGRIVEGHLRRYGPGGPSGDPSGDLDAAHELVQAGLWEKEGEGAWLIAGWMERNASSDEVDTSRDEGKRNALKRWHKAGKHATTPNPECPECPPPAPPTGDPSDPPIGGRTDPPMPETETETETESTGPNGPGGKPPRTTTVPEFDEPLPVSPGWGDPLYLLLRTWAVEAGFERPDDRAASVQWQWLMQVVDEVLGDGKHSHGVRVSLCGEFVGHVTGEPLERPTWQHLRQLVSLHSGALTLKACGEACKWGAGLRPQDRGDPLSLTKYAAVILSNWAEAA